MSLNKRKRLLGFLIGKTSNGHLQRGAQKAASEEFGMTQPQISHLWKHWNAQKTENDAWSALSPKRLNGCRPTYDRDEVKLKISEIPYEQQRTFRTLAGALDVSLGTVFQ